MAQSGETGSARAMEIWLLPFAAMFTQPSWLNAVALATGALLCLNRRTVCAALRAVDGPSDKGFSRFHRFLSRGAWSGLTVLLGLLLKAFVPDGQPLVIGVDDTIERRRGSKIRDKEIYRDPVRSSRGFLVKVEGLRCLSLQVLARPGFATRTWGLPFLPFDKLRSAVPFGTGQCQEAAAIPDGAGEGGLGDAADGPLVSAPAAGDGGRRRFRQPGALPHAALPCPVRGSLPDRCAVLQSTASTQDRTEGAAARYRHPSADAKDPVGQEGHQVGTHDHSGMAGRGWHGRSASRCGDWNGPVERARHHRAGALGADAGPGWARRDARLRLLRPAEVSVGDPDLVCDAMGG